MPLHPGTSFSSLYRLKNKTKKKNETISQNYDFIPDAGTCQNWDKKSVNELGSIFVMVSGDVRAKSLIIQRISMSVQRRNNADYTTKCFFEWNIFNLINYGAYLFLNKKCFY